MSTVAEQLTAALRAMQSYASGDQIAPCAILWPDPESLWEEVMPALKKIMPELFQLGAYDAQERTGPAVWLRCIEAGVVDGSVSTGAVPVFYLPGISRDRLRQAEDCPPEVAPLVELQYRGVTWLHENGKESTPYGFLVSKLGGLGLDAPKDEATKSALAGALPWLIKEPLSHLQGRRLDSEFFNSLLVPDTNALLLRWLGNEEAFKKQRSDSEWKAFCNTCKVELHFDPAKDGPLMAAKLLAARTNAWHNVWERFAESPNSYADVVDWLKRAAPKETTLFDTAEVWPTINQAEEQKLQQALRLLVDKQQDEAINRLAQLEKEHEIRRGYAWQKLGLSPFATVLQPLSQLAQLCKMTPGAATPQAYAEFYAQDGWRVDAAAIKTMATCEAIEQPKTVLAILQAVYLPWLEGTSRYLQNLVHVHGQSVLKRGKPMQASAGRIILFADGLRMDIARQLAEKLAAGEIESKLEWDWSTVPSITAIAKPAASPLADDLQGGEAGEEFSTRLISTGQVLTADRFSKALAAAGWQCLRGDETGDPTGSAWTEAGALDKRGHDEGWKLARNVDTEVRDLVSRIAALLKAGWTDVVVITDHGWLLMPGGLPKVELKAFLTEHQWGRCAALKPGVQTDTQTFRWQWNKDVMIASPPGAGCYRASVEYSHGGISLQEMVTPILRISGAKRQGDSARILEAKWTGAKCRVSVGGDYAGRRVDVRAGQSDPNTSLLADRQAREITKDGKVTVFLEEDADIGKKANIVLLDKDGRVIDSQSTTLGE